MELRRLSAFAAIVRESRPIRARERSDVDRDGSDLTWLFAALPTAALLAWLVIVAQR